MPKFRHQIVPIAGDCSASGLGLTSADRTMITREVSIIFHGAATVRFDEKLKLAVAINVQAPKDIMELGREMPKLKVYTANAHLYDNLLLDNYAIKLFIILRALLPFRKIGNTPKIVYKAPIRRNHASRRSLLSRVPNVV